MNDYRQRYAAEEIPQIYSRSKVVVNISRGDFKEDANTRCFEAAGAGALLITNAHTELTRLGFRDGVHFVGYSKERAIADIVARYLANEDERARIAGAGRSLVMEQHTYDARARQLVDVVSAREAFAPARSWSESKLAFLFCHYYAKKGYLKEAVHECVSSIWAGPWYTLIALFAVCRCTYHKLLRLARFSN
jgi:spore maturation protein CgeB